MIGELWVRWVAAMAQKEEGTCLALLRIGVGLVLLWDLALTWIHGVIPLIWGSVREDPEAFRKATEDWLFQLLGGADLEKVKGICLGTMLAALLLVLGIWPR